MTCLDCKYCKVKDEMEYAKSFSNEVYVRFKCDKWQLTNWIRTLNTNPSEVDVCSDFEKEDKC